MSAFGPQRIVVAIIILVIAGFLGAVVGGGDDSDESAAVTAEADADTSGSEADGDQLVGVTTPPAEFSMWQVLTSGDTDSFAALAEAAGMRRDLESLVDADRVPLDRTVFAPTDAALAAFGDDVGDPLQTVALVGFHTIDGQRLRSGDLVELDGQTLTTVLGEPLAISVVAGEVVLNGTARIISSNVVDNGVVHVIDTVLVPE